MSRSVVVIDYGCGNLLSVSRALEYLGAVVTITGDRAAVLDADRLVLPGVGAFGKAMEELNRLGLVDAIRQFGRSGRPFFGICLGMQLMLQRSYEFGRHEGLGLIPGEVVPIPETTADGEPLKRPHIGWNELEKAHGASWKHTTLDDAIEGQAVYFVHSFVSHPESESHILAHADYKGRKLVAAIGDGALQGIQFHPEKSGTVGLRILENFLSLPPAQPGTPGTTTKKPVEGFVR
jgi:glutamine amidotransferase